MSFRTTLFAALLLATSLAPAAYAQDYPTRPITIVVPYGPGSATDNVVRPVALALQKALGQSVIIDNKAGANGVIGTQFGARAKPDGYTLLAGSSTTLPPTPACSSPCPMTRRRISFRSPAWPRLR